MTLQLGQFNQKYVTIVKTVDEKKSNSNVDSSEILPLYESNQECDMFDYQCEKEITMKKHRKTKQKVQMHVDIIKCKACENQFDSKDDLAVHITEKPMVVRV